EGFNRRVGGGGGKGAGIPAAGLEGQGPVVGGVGTLQHSTSPIGGGRMTLPRTTRVAYGLLGLLYVCLGVGSMVLPIGWLPEGSANRLLAGETLDPFGAHLLQEFGTVVL